MVELPESDKRIFVTILWSKLRSTLTEIEFSLENQYNSVINYCGTFLMHWFKKQSCISFLTRSFSTFKIRPSQLIAKMQEHIYYRAVATVCKERGSIRLIVLRVIVQSLAVWVCRFTILICGKCSYTKKQQYCNKIGPILFACNNFLIWS